MLHKETASSDLLEVLQSLISIPELSSFRLVGGTAIALQIGHRTSVDIDLFSNEKANKTAIRKALAEKFQDTKITLTQNNLLAIISGIRVDIYDDWLVPFKKAPVIEEGLRLAALQDLAAFKLSCITERREKKDYIDLFFLFKKLGALTTLKEFKTYEPLLSHKSILFALAEVKTAQENASPMPDILIKTTWGEINLSMVEASKNYLSLIEEERNIKKREDKI